MSHMEKIADRYWWHQEKVEREITHEHSSYLQGWDDAKEFFEDQVRSWLIFLGDDTNSPVINPFAEEPDQDGSGELLIKLSDIKAMLNEEDE